jgi:hypothetical protein
MVAKQPARGIMVSMTKARKPDDEDYRRAAWFVDKPAPPRDWFDQGACNGAPASDFPEEQVGPAAHSKAARAFIRKYCGHCTVRVECTLDMLKKGIPDGSVHGGMVPGDATRLAKAAAAIHGSGGLEQATAVLAKDLTPIVPDYIQLQPEALPPQPPTTQ